tara:strand:+ start:5837 stop:6907 length:1071 start_codon:yes stop_codon:yes gene_type:complete
MLPYVLIYLLLCLSGAPKMTKGASAFVVFFWGFFLLLFMGTRYWVGCDYFGYLSRFNNIDYQGSFISYLSREEPGFHLLNYFVHYFDLGYVWLISVSSFIVLVCYIRFSFLSTRPLLVLALLFPVMIVQLGMSGLRQAVAAGFVMMAMSSFTKLRKVYFVFFILLASTFHKSAIVFFPLFFLIGKEVSGVKIFSMSFLFIPLVGFLLGDRLDVYQDRYVDQIYGESTSGGALIRYVLILIPYAVFLWVRNAVKLGLPQIYTLMNLFMFITFSVLPLAFFSTTALHRIIYYLMPVSILVFVSCVPYFVKPSFVRVSVLLPALVYGVYMVGWFGSSRHADSCYVPYKSELFIDEFGRL